MMLRRFYLSENANGQSSASLPISLRSQKTHRSLSASVLAAPNPRKKTTRVLKFDIPPPSSSPVPSRPSSVPPPIPAPATTNGEGLKEEAVQELGAVMVPVRKAVEE